MAYQMDCGLGRNIGSDTDIRFDHRQTLDLVIVVAGLCLATGEIETAQEVTQGGSVGVVGA